MRYMSLVLVMLLGKVFGAVPVTNELEWTKVWGTVGDDYAEGVAVDSLDCIYVTGKTDGSLDGNFNAGMFDIFLTKYDAAGNKLWTRQWGTTADDAGDGVAVDDLDNVYVTGYTDGSLDGNSNTGGSDIFLTKYDTNGNKVWTRQWGGGTDEKGHGVAVGDASVFVTGYTNGSIDSYPLSGMHDMFISKFDLDGNRLWTVQRGAVLAYTRGYAIALSGPFVYVTGSTDGQLDGNAWSGGDDIFLIQYDNSGSWLWTKEWGTNNYEAGNGVATDGGGNPYVAGYTGGDLDGNTNSGGNDIFLTKHDVTGTKLWTKVWGTDGTDTGRDVVVDSGGNPYVVGDTDGDLDGNVNSGYYDVFVTKYDTDGFKLWTKGWGGVSNEIGMGIATDGDDNLFVTGFTLGSLEGNPNSGINDAFLSKLAAPAQPTGSNAVVPVLLYLLN